MAITTLDGLIAGMLPPIEFYKVQTSMEAAGLSTSLWGMAGIPGAGTTAGGLAGEALTSSSSERPGQLSFPAAVTGKSIYLARLTASFSTASVSGITLMDRLWHNSGFVVTSTAAQTIDSATFASRDANGGTNGVGVMIAMEVTSALGAGTPTLTVTYTNSSGTAGRTGTIGPISTTSAAGTFYPMQLQSGDVGVNSVQSIQSGATMTSGSVSFVAYRTLAQVAANPLAGVTVDRDAVALGVPKLHNGSVPFLTLMPTSTAALNVSGSVVWARG